MGGKPFQSRLTAHVPAIAARRRGGHTWREIAAGLTEEGCATDAGTLCRFFTRWKRRPYALGTEPEPQTPSAPSVSPAVPPAAGPPARVSSATATTATSSAVEEARRRAAESQKQREAESAGWDSLHTGGPLSKSRPNP